MFGLFKSKIKTVRVPLEVLSVLWTNADDMKTNMCLQGNIANHASHNQNSRPGATDQPVQHAHVSFNSKEIQEFYKKYMVQTMRGQALNIIIKLLHVLDEKGACPSVVHGDGETPEEYRCLGSVTLTQHSLNVARKAFDILNRGRRIIRNNTADVLIAALGHDIGKIPGLAHKEIPGHTFRTVGFLRPLLSSLGSRERILEAVRLLHVPDKDRKGGEKDLSILSILVQADIQARQAELKAVQAEPAAQPNACEETPERPPTVEARRLGKGTLLRAIKPLLLKDVHDSFIFRDKVFLSPAFVKQVATNLAQGRGDEDFLQSCTEKEVVKLLGWSGAAPTFTVRFYKRELKPVTHEYISLDKEAFGNLSGLKERQKAQGVRKVVCVSESARS
jgi:hypothetical protein